jgi:hypothetical protein
MLSPLIRRPGRSATRQSRQRGVTLLLVAVAMFSVIAMAALSIDVGTLYQASAEAQRAADAGALAAARLISMSGVTGNTNFAAYWRQICGSSSSPASSLATAVAQQNTIAGASNSTVVVTYSTADATASGSTDCTTLTDAFGANPLVTVKVTQSGLPTYFSRIWSRTGGSVSATATAEAFNPSNAGSYAVQPRCAKPWIVPNYDPIHPAQCNTGGSNPQCNVFVDTSNNGAIFNQGTVTNGGVIGEQFWLVPVCSVDPNQKGACFPFRTNPPEPPPIANFAGDSTSPPPPPTYANLEYLPGQAPPTSTAVPTSKGGACSDVTSSLPYAEAIAGCDQSTQYQCGVSSKNVVDVSENPGNGDTGNGVQCLTHQATSESQDTNLQVSGQDTLDPFATSPSAAATYPFVIQAGTDNPLTSAGLSSGSTITSSTSIVSLPIYAPGVTINISGTTNVTIVGFLQVFINFVDRYGNVYVTVMNVTGCASNPGTVFTGTSPVPVRLITLP